MAAIIVGIVIVSYLLLAAGYGLAVKVLNPKPVAMGTILWHALIVVLPMAGVYLCPTVMIGLSEPSAAGGDLILTRHILPAFAATFVLGFLVPLLALRCGFGRALGIALLTGFIFFAGSGVLVLLNILSLLAV
jgi:hypothetical protein